MGINGIHLNAILMRKILFLLALLPLSVHAQELNGPWKGKLVAGLQTLTVVLHIDQDAKTVSLDVLEQGADNLPMEVKWLSADSIHAVIKAANISYSGKLVDGKLKGTFWQGMGFQLDFEPGEVAFNRPQEPQPPFPYMTEEVTFVNSAANVTLAGTLTYPVGYKKKKSPVVLMVTGSGAQNRDEELFKHKPFLLLADWLARHGIASLRYDDRGTAASTGVFADATTADFAEDARAGIQYLRSLKKFRQVGIMGHSEGGAIAFMLGSEGVVGCIVSLAARAGRIDTMMVHQLNLVGRSRGMDSDMVKTTEATRNSLTKSSGGKWMDYFLDMDLTPYVQKTLCPVLALGAENDLNVPPMFNTPALESNLPKNKHNLIKVYPGLSHLFQHNPTGNLTLSFGIEETIAPEVLNDISDWILSVTKR